MYPDERAPHHCAFVDAAFGDWALRLDRADHEEAGASVAAGNWKTFVATGAPQEPRT
jgi:hypothetical protein